MDRQGFTLIEVSISMTILIIVMGILFAISQNTSRAAAVQNAQITAANTANTMMRFVEKQLRQAAWSSINTGDLPGPSITYRVPVDLDGNGLPVDTSGEIELSPVRTISPDVNDLNRNGRTDTELIVYESDPAAPYGVRILFSRDGLAPQEDTNHNGILDSGETDTNRNGRADTGLWFEQTGQAITITIEGQYTGPTVDRRALTATQIVTVVPRN